MKCPICSTESDSLKTAIKDGQYVSERCERCISNFKAGAEFARRHEREWQKRHYKRDTIQRWDGDKPNEEFIREYPDVAVKQWGQDILRDYGVKRKLL